MARKIKHIVVTNFLSYQINIKDDVTSDQMINYRLTYLVGNLIPTLNNQTSQDFEFLLKVNPNISDEQIGRIENAVRSTAKFKYAIKKYNDDTDIYIEKNWNENDVLIISKIDDDDFIHKNAVLWAENTVPMDQFDFIIVCGYKRLWKYIQGSMDIGFESYIPGDGHMSVFQSFIYDTHSIKYDRNLIGDRICHDLIGKTFSEKGYKFKVVDFDNLSDEPLGIYFRHDRADSYSRENYHKTYQQDADELKNIHFTDALIEKFKDLFNFVPCETPKKYSVAMVAIARRENLYINNWIEYHRKLGFDHFYVYDNSCGDDIHLDKSLSDKNREYTTIIPIYDRKNFHIEVYNQAYRTFGKNYDYMMFLDIDEFFTLNWHRSIQEYIHFLKWQCPHFHTAKINWEIYDDSDVIERDTSIPVQEFFTHLSETDTSIDNNCIVKSIVKTGIQSLEFTSVHFAVALSQYLVVVNSYGKMLDLSIPTNYNFPGYAVPRDVRMAKIRHYITKTLSEFIEQQDETTPPDGWRKRDAYSKFFCYCKQTTEKVDYYEKHRRKKETD